MIKSLVSLLRRPRERDLYRTQTGAFRLGDIVSIDGDFYRVTRWKGYGGVVVVYGIPARPAAGEPIARTL